jgi:hypothetical protein
MAYSGAAIRHRDRCGRMTLELTDNSEPITAGDRHFKHPSGHLLADRRQRFVGNPSLIALRQSCPSSTCLWGSSATARRALILAVFIHVHRPRWLAQRVPV